MEISPAHCAVSPLKNYLAAISHISYRHASHKVRHDVRKEIRFIYRCPPEENEEKLPHCKNNCSIKAFKASQIKNYNYQN